MQRSLAVAVLASSLVSAIAVPAASADPGSTNPVVQYRTLTCSDGRTYQAGFVGPGADFFLVASTDVYVLKELTLYFPGGGSETFDYGIKGFDNSQLVDCWYTDPQGVFTVGQGFFTPAG